MRTDTAYHPLTQSQTLLWIGQEMNPESSMYNMVMTYNLKVPIHKKAFKMAFTALLEQYDALRSVVEVEGGTPFQVFLKNHPYTLDYLDFSNKQDPKQAYITWRDQKIQVPFDLSTCLLDSALIKIHKSHYIWYINQHHLITDAWSNSLLFKTISDFYEQFKNEELPLSIPKINSYQSYQIKEKLEITLEKNNSSKAFWKDKIRNVPPLPVLYNNPPIKTAVLSTRSKVNLGIKRSNKLRKLANTKGVRVWTEHLSLYNIFLTTLFAYLHRVSGQNKLVIGSTTHNRTSKGLRETVGYFVEVFPLFTTINDVETFSTLLQKIQKESNNFLKHAKSGLASPRLHKSFNVLFNYIHAEYPDFEGTPVDSEWVHTGHHDPRHHIRLHVHDLHKTGEIQLYFDLNNHVFDTKKQALISEHFIALLDAFIKDKEQPIMLPSIITQYELDNYKITLQNNIHTTSKTQNLVTLIEEQTLKTPFVHSVLFKNRSYTYQELNSSVNQLAHYLIEQHIGIGSQVAICLKRSPEYIITVLAILKTGATYVPIPYNYPLERIQYIIKDSQASLIIAHNDKQLVLDGLKTIKTLTIDAVLQTISTTYPTKNISVHIPPKTVAFLIYTSGSTGDPKGVKITHEAITNYILWSKDAYIITHTIDTVAIPLFTTVGFDITANSVFLPLICGGTIYVYQEKDTEIDLSITEVIEDNNVTFIKVTPAHLNFLKGKDLTHSKVQVMVVTGDEFKTSLGLDIYNAFNGQVDIYNEYGPSEATIGCVFHKFNPETDTAASIPIGLPIKNSQLYLLDRFLNPVPQGVIGELYIGGSGLSSGYWNRPELTVSKFIQHPTVPSNTIYRTEDLARINEDGILEFLGRRDFQVKINGYRIELGEIEARILAYPKIKTCSVIVLKNEDESKSLASYFTSKTNIDTKQLQQFIAQRLPKYMVPNHYKQLESLPLSQNGKVDRNALRIIKTDTTKTTTPYVAPRNEIEQEVAAIWIQVFNISKIGVFDRFIELGGESLMAIQITTRISETFEFKIPLNALFELQTIANIATYIEETLIGLLNE